MRRESAGSGGLWVCPDCGRSFRRRRQAHYCGQAPADVDDYIARQPEAVRPFLRQLREAIRAAGPELEERILWHMPSYWRGQHIFQFAAHSAFVSLYVPDEALEALGELPEGASAGKGSLRLSYSQPLPEALIQKLTRFCARHYALDPNKTTRGGIDDGTEQA